MPASLPTPHAADAMAAVAVLNFRGCERLTAFGTRWCRRRRGRRRSRDRRRRRRLGGGFARQQFSAQMRAASVRPSCSRRFCFCTRQPERSEEHTSELQSLMRISYAVFCVKKKKHTIKHIETWHLS